MDGHLAPSHLYARPQAPSDVASENFQWGEDAASTIAPDDSVSQIDRRFTGRRPMLGPRAMDHVAAVPEERGGYHEQADDAVHRDYVPPELLEDDRSTVVPTPAAARHSQPSRGPSSAGVRAVNPSTTVGPLARARGESNPGVVPYAAAGASSSSPAQDHYHGDEDDDASHPLVPGSGSGLVGPAGVRSAAATTVTPYSRPAKGYAALGGGDDDDEDDDGGVYAAYSRQRDADLEAKADASASVRHARDDSRDSAAAAGAAAAAGGGGGVLGGFLSSLRGAAGRGGGRDAQRDRDGSFYMPNELAFRPPSGGSSFDMAHKTAYPPSPYATRDTGHTLDKVPSLDVAPAHDRSFSSTGYGATGARGESVQPKPLWQRWIWDTTDAERRVWEHKRGVGMQRWPFASWGLAVVMAAVRLDPLPTMFVRGSCAQKLTAAPSWRGPTGHGRRACAHALVHRLGYPDQALVQRHDRSALLALHPPASDDD